MKQLSILLNIPIFIFFIGTSLCLAEKIYRKDGKVVSGNILYRSKHSVWIKHKFGSVGIALKDIDKILNDGGSISKYDYKSQSRLIQEYIKQKKYTEATELCSLLLESFPDDIQIHYLRGMLNQKTGNLKEAAEDYNFLIAQKAADEKILNNLGAIYAKNKEYKEAMELFIIAAIENPNMAETHQNLAELLMQHKDYKGAIEEFTKVTALEPNNQTALYNLGIAYMNSGNYAKAKEQWEKVLTLNPQDNDTKNALLKLKKQSEQQAN